MLQICWRVGVELRMSMINRKNSLEEKKKQKKDAIQLDFPLLDQKNQLQLWRMGKKKDVFSIKRSGGGGVTVYKNWIWANNVVLLQNWEHTGL